MKVQRVKVDNIMNIRDIVTLSDDNEYQVISKTNYEGLVYYYLVDMNDISNIKFLYENGDRLTETEDSDLIKELLPKFLSEIQELI